MTAKRYRFRPAVPASQIEAVAALAALAASGLHGDPAVRQLASVRDRAVTVDASTPAGRDLVAVVDGLARRGFGPGAYTVEEILAPHLAPHPQASADGLFLLEPDDERGGDNDE